MNERIKELADQCSEMITGIDESEFFDKEKFAELIVKECIDVIKNESMGSTDEWENGLHIAIEAIKHNLGDE